MKTDLDSDFLSQRLIGSLSIMAQLLLDHGVDNHASNQHDDSPANVRYGNSAEKPLLSIRPWSLT